MGGIPTTEPRGSETTAQQIHKEGTQYVKEATQANQQSMQRGSSAAEGTGYSISTGPDYTDSGRSEALGSTNTSANNTTSAYPSTSTNPVSSAQDPASGAGSHSTKPEPRSDSSANKMEPSEPRQQSYEDSTEKSVKHEKSDEDKHSKAHKGGSSKAENPDSIPTAGGEKLGEKHWGESQIVPELPPKRGSDAGQGASSSDGQPTSEVADNTAANTGGAKGGPHDSTGSEAHKEGAMDKIKHSLHMGKK